MREVFVAGKPFAEVVAGTVTLMKREKIPLNVYIVAGDHGPDQATLTFEEVDSEVYVTLIGAEVARKQALLVLERLTKIRGLHSNNLIG